MKSQLSALFLLAAAAAGPLFAQGGEQLIPAGSLISCTVSEPKLSSKTADVGDPVLCRVSHVELYGRSTLPYGSYLVGRFEDYKDPGHLVGKGFMELKFDRMVVQPDTVIPVDAKVVYVKGYNVDKQGRILGKGHAVRDTVEWLIPVLWPLDLINLPRRGPRPTLKEETKLELKIMDDIGVPMPGYEQQPGLQHRAPVAYQQAEPAPVAAPIVQNFIQEQPVQQTYAQSYAPAPVQPHSVMVPVPYGRGYVMRRMTGPYPAPGPAYASGPGYQGATYGPPPAPMQPQPY